MPHKEGSNKTVLRMSFYGQAVMFGAAGLACFIFPEAVQEFMGFDALSTQILGGAALACAIGDIIAAKFIFKD